MLSRKEMEKQETKEKDQNNLRKDIRFIKKNVLVLAKRDAETSHSCYIY